jgi:hypothetical protein
MKPVSFITSRMLVKGQGGSEFQSRDETAHLILRFAGKRFWALARAAGNIESDAIKLLRLIILTTLAPGIIDAPELDYERIVARDLNIYK